MKNLLIVALLISSTLYTMDKPNGRPYNTNTSSTTKKSSKNNCCTGLKSPEFRRFLSEAVQTAISITRQILLNK